MTRYGYIRASETDESEDFENQKTNLLEASADEIIIEKALTNVANRPILEDLVASLRPGDVLLVDSLHRLGKDARAVRQIINQLAATKSELFILNRRLSSLNKMFVESIAAVAEMERENQGERTRQGLKKAVSEGRKLGRKVLMSDEQYREIYQLADEGKTQTEISLEMQKRYWEPDPIHGRPTFSQPTISRVLVERPLREPGLKGK